MVWTTTVMGTSMKVFLELSPRRGWRWFWSGRGSCRGFEASQGMVQNGGDCDDGDREIFRCLRSQYDRQ